MSIWVFSDPINDREAIVAAISTHSCLFCNTRLDTLKSEAKQISYSFIEQDAWSIYLSVRCCRLCGWWTLCRTSRVSRGLTTRPVKEFTDGATALLRQLSLADQSMPICDIRDYLAAKYDARFHIDPWRFEEVVASVYEDFGYHTRVTARSSDGGIDVILDGPENSVIGIQVKRYRDKINVEQIRAFTGALFLKGIAQGVFITTSSFQTGAQSASDISKMRGIPIELIDATSFYQALGLAQREMYKSINDRAFPFSERNLTRLLENDL